MKKNTESLKSIFGPYVMGEFLYKTAKDSEGNEGIREKKQVFFEDIDDYIEQA